MSRVLVCDLRVKKKKKLVHVLYLRLSIGFDEGSRNVCAARTEVVGSLLGVGAAPPDRLQEHQRAPHIPGRRDVSLPCAAVAELHEQAAAVARRFA
eukprot:3085598-Prymnesium_polylepis.1